MASRMFYLNEFTKAVRIFNLNVEITLYLLSKLIQKATLWFISFHFIHEDDTLTILCKWFQIISILVQLVN